MIKIYIASVESIVSYYEYIMPASVLTMRKSSVFGSLGHGLDKVGSKLDKVGRAGLNLTTAAASAAATTAAAAAGLESSSHNALTPEEQELQKRVKTLLKEDGNTTCAECRTKKPKWMSLLQAPIDETGRVGVFCCNECYVFHLAMGEDFCTVKSLKKPQECKY